MLIVSVFPTVIAFVLAFLFVLSLFFVGLVILKKEDF
jgi:hypothetical protein